MMMERWRIYIGGRLERLVTKIKMINVMAIGKRMMKTFQSLIRHTWIDSIDGNVVVDDMMNEDEFDDWMIRKSSRYEGIDGKIER